jgi:hypothetical protein
MLDVLFVDDEHSVLEALRDALRSQRYAWRMRFAAGGRDALALLDQQLPDVIVTDLRMPGIEPRTRSSIDPPMRNSQSPRGGSRPGSRSGCTASAATSSWRRSRLTWVASWSAHRPTCRPGRSGQETVTPSAFAYPFKRTGPGCSRSRSATRAPATRCRPTSSGAPAAGRSSTSTPTEPPMPRSITPLALTALIAIYGVTITNPTDGQPL